MKIHFKLQNEVGSDLESLCCLLEEMELTRVTHVELDLSEIILPNSGLMGSLYHLHLNLVRRGKSLRVLGVNERTAKTLALARLDEVFEVLPFEGEDVDPGLCAD